MRACIKPLDKALLAETLETIENLQKQLEESEKSSMEMEDITAKATPRLPWEMSCVLASKP
jgi:hypothetical protein